MTAHRPSALPTEPHPIATAFFSAHDGELETPKEAAPGAGVVAKMRNSLGWRTRNSSARSYPISVVPVDGRRRPGERGGGSISFSVRQVFPGGSDRERARGNGAGGDGEARSRQPQPRDPVGEGDCELGTGATVWPGSIVLLKYLERIAHDPQQRNVMLDAKVADLGSGTAITSIASALLGASEVVCTDGCDPVVELAKQNIHDAIFLLGAGEEVPQSTGRIRMDETKHCNIRGCKMSAKRYRWGEGMPVDESPLGDQQVLSENQPTDAFDNKMQSNGKHFDIILGADCIVPKLYPIEPLVDALDELSGDATVTYLSYEQRHYERFDPAAEFNRLAELRNLVVDIVQDHEMHPMYPASDIEVWRVTRNNEVCIRDGNSKKTVSKVRSDREHDANNHKSLLVGNDVFVGCGTQQVPAKK